MMNTATTLETITKTGGAGEIDTLAMADDGSLSAAIADISFSDEQVDRILDRKTSDEKQILTSPAITVITEGNSGNTDVDINDCGATKKRIIVDGDEDVVFEIAVFKPSSYKRVRLNVELNLSLWWKEEQVEEYYNNTVAVMEGNLNDHKSEEANMITQQHEKEDIYRNTAVFRKEKNGRDLDLSLWWKEEQVEESYSNAAVMEGNNDNHQVEEGI